MWLGISKDSWAQVVGAALVGAIVLGFAMVIGGYGFGYANHPGAERFWIRLGAGAIVLGVGGFILGIARYGFPVGVGLGRATSIPESQLRLAEVTAISLFS